MLLRRRIIAEYKNGVNFRGNMSVEADDISPEVKTGRVVFVDEDLYESNEEYKAKVDKCVEEGFMRSDEAGSGGSSGGASGMVVNAIDHPEQTKEILDKTWAEIKAAVSSGQAVWIHRPGEEGYYEDQYAMVTSVEHAIRDGVYSLASLSDYQFNCDSADGYPNHYYGD